MQIEATRGALLMRFGRRFAAAEAQRLAETIVAFGPVTQVTIDFSEVREFEDAAVVPLAQTIRGLGAVRVLLRGLTLHQARVLRYLGVEPGSQAPGPADAEGAAQVVATA